MSLRDRLEKLATLWEGAPLNLDARTLDACGRMLREVLTSEWDPPVVVADWRRLRAALAADAASSGSTLPGAMHPELVHAREVAIALERIAAGEPVAEVEEDYGFPGGMLGAASPQGERERALEEAAKVADHWAAQYPVDVFPEDSPSLDAKAAGHGRHVAKEIAKDLRTLAASSPHYAEKGDAT